MLVKELGFDGLGHLWLDNVPERLKTLDEAGLKLYWIHTTVNVNPKNPPFDPKLLQVLPVLKDRGVLLSINTVGYKPSDETADPRAVEIFREIADKAAASGVRVVLYHHRNDWTERFEDCVRVAKKVDRPNVGVMFNLCHWVLKGREENLRELLESAKPHLFCVAINAWKKGTGTEPVAFIAGLASAGARSQSPFFHSDLLFESLQSLAIAEQMIELGLHTDNWR